MSKATVVKLLISLAVAGVFGAIMHAGAMPLVPEPQWLEAIAWWGIPVYALMWCGVHVLRAVRWQLLLRPVAQIPLREVVAVSFIGYFAILALPARTGEFVRPLLIRRQGRISGWAAAGTIGAERLVDGLLLSLLLFAALQWSTPLEPLPSQIGHLPISVSVVPRGAYLALVAFAAALGLTVAFYFWEQQARRVLEWTIGRVSPRLASWLSARVGSVAEGLSFLGQPRSSIPFTLVTLAYWVLNAASSWLLASSLGFEDFSLARGCVVTGVLALGILVPNAPGFFGTFQVSLYAGLAVFYPTEAVLGRGAAFVFYMYLGQIAVTVVFALLAAAMYPHIFRGIWGREASQSLDEQ